MLLVNVLRDMRTSGRWASLDGSADTLGAEAFDQTFDVELSRYLAQAGGIGLSQRLLSAFDAFARIAEAAPAGAGGGASAAATSSGTGDMPATTPPGASPSVIPTGNAAAYTGRTGWKGLRLEAPSYGGSAAQWAGFNNDRAMAGGDDSSVKDAFFRWTYGLSYNPAGHSKEQIEAYLRDNLQSAREYGLNILEVEGEKILVETEERGPEWVDVVGSAGSMDAKWQWLCQEEFGAPVGGGTLGAALASLRSSPNGDQRARAVLTSGNLTGDALMAALQAEASGNGGSGIPAATPSTLPGPQAPSGPVTSEFGWREDPITGLRTFHSGIDVLATEGAQVASTGAGRVVFAGTQNGYGNTVIVEHANGLSTRYAHLSRILVSADQLVQDGSVVGLAGQTGRATGPHLHYEVLMDGRAVDPLQR
jgi:murein DD-endopeptidase MepM/ murein hydrolase activator NlpD